MNKDILRQSQRQIQGWRKYGDVNGYKDRPKDRDRDRDGDADTDANTNANIDKEVDAYSGRDRYRREKSPSNMCPPHFLLQILGHGLFI